MNGPIKMYKLKSVVPLDLNVTLPNCMYKMKTIHPRNGEQTCKSCRSSENLDTFKQVKEFLKNQETTPEMAELEIKQQQILLLLTQLKNQLNHIRTNLHREYKSTGKLTKNEEYTNESSKNDKIQINNFPSDIIINASPRNPPISLLILRNILKKYVDFSVKVHQHSSIVSVCETTKKFVESLENFKGNPELPKINLRLIWKDVGANMELMVSQVVIQGEINFLRYVARLFPNVLYYEDSSDVGKVDNLLDVSYRIVTAKTRTERASLLQIFNKSLSKGLFLVGSKFSIVDLAAYSAIQQVSISDLNSNLSKWFKRCESF